MPNFVTSAKGPSRAIGSTLENGANPELLHIIINSLTMADIMDGEEQWMKLDKEGKQPYMGARLTPADLLKKLKCGGVKQWQPNFTAIIKPECGGLCVLERKACKMNLSPVNRARAQKRYKCPSAALAAAGGSTSKQAMEEEKRSREEDEVDELGRPPFKKTALQRFTVSCFVAIIVDQHERGASKGGQNTMKQSWGG